MTTENPSSSPTSSQEETSSPSPQQHPEHVMRIIKATVRNMIREVKEKEEDTTKNKTS